MDIKIVKTCPLGHECRKTVGEHIEECMWLVKLQGDNPQNGDKIDEYNCAIAWQPILMVETSGQMRGVAASIQSMRNETIKRQDIALGLVEDAKVIGN